ncbi:hypothetical protein [Komagataeibacter europaeus]|uniref:hypothetical protein n=1 Tax=Komagataeibacter europaeus TaxID=33995 RepID=UPI0012DF5E99|nr:hypothetical protein [Komagataeibacter europaeus]
MNGPDQKQRGRESPPSGDYAGHGKFLVMLFLKNRQTPSVWKKAASRNFCYFYQGVIFKYGECRTGIMQVARRPLHGGPCSLPTAGISGHSLVNGAVVR